MKSFEAMVRVGQSAVLSAVAATVLIAPLSAVAGGSEVKMRVSATVLGKASLQVMSQPSMVVVTQADIARGYVDVAAPSQIAIESNSRSGYVLEFANDGDFMRQILVKGLASDVQLSPSGGTVVQPTSGVTKTTLALGYRFVLAQSTQQGTYPWPVRLAVTAL